MTLKSRLKRCDLDADNDKLDLLIEEMLNNIGSTDSELRDQLIYQTFGNLIMENYLSKEQEIHILEGCRKRLFYQIGVKNDDSVFTRSFSALVIVLILEKDTVNRNLADELVLKVIEDSICYVKLEEDVRGFVQDKGWAHSVAHGADLLTAAVNHPCFTIGYTSECLDALKAALFKQKENNLPFIDDEDERLVFVMEALITKGASEDKLISWIKEISETLHHFLESEDFYPGFLMKKSDVIHFFRSCYFRLLYKNQFPELTRSIACVLEQWHMRLYQSND
ncbi:DUF2785 domain-containing protein [Gracilibacillus oryzae]|uniref:DUF2785 domain-containing protein n=1 Tax=Gracilibacillus oryzae TaxID=1672701 RepID=A0A7C8GU72_9BACI|nr:DUF2785 domain-containing protein [Gracilibacillus oryzae]KAB8138075.1 DUF2785 domain-containing protein [Gracilibacillus oryzae]